MFERVVLMLFLSWFMLPTAHAQSKKPHVAPKIVTAQIVKDGKLQVLIHKETLVPETRTRLVPVFIGDPADQKVKYVPESYVVHRSLVQTVTQIAEEDQYRFFNLDGKRVVADVVQKKLTKPTPILQSLDKQPIPKVYLSLFKKDALVVIINPGGFNDDKNKPPIPKPRIKPDVKK